MAKNLLAKLMMTMRKRKMKKNMMKTGNNKMKMIMINICRRKMKIITMKEDLIKIIRIKKREWEEVLQEHREMENKTLLLMMIPTRLKKFSMTLI